MVRRQVKRFELENNLHVGWNAFVDLIATEDFAHLSEVQKIPHLVFWYDAEVQNGGHLQYFANSSGRRAGETLDALLKLGMDCQRAILSDALAFVSQHPLPELGSVEDYVSEELEDTLGSFNSRYYACSKHTNQYLEEYLNHNFDDFIELI